MPQNPPAPAQSTMSTAACDQAPPPTALEPDSEECEYIIVEFNAADHSAADILATVESMTVQVCSPSLKRASLGIYAQRLIPGISLSNYQPG